MFCECTLTEPDHRLSLRNSFCPCCHTSWLDYFVKRYRYPL